MRNVVSLKEAGSEDEVGSKAYELGKVYDKTNVPEGFVVTSGAFDDFLESRGFKDRILSILSRTKVDDRDDLVNASREIQGTLDEATVPENFREEIEEAYKDMIVSSEARKAGEKAMELIKAGREKPSVVLRPSPKRNGDSFAGVYESKLNVRGDENLLDEVKNVWKSFYSPRAIYYRERCGYGHDQPFGVLVQKMAEPEKTVNYIAGNPANPDEAALEAVYGFGKALSEGEITPDVYIFDKFTSDLKDRKISNKRWQQKRNASTGNIEKQSIPSERENSEVLDEKDIKRLLEEVGKIKSGFNFSPLMEFGIKKGDVFLIDVSPLSLGGSPESADTGDKELVKGICASPGKATGEVTKNRNGPEDKVLVTKNLRFDDIYYGEMSAVVSDYGGISSNVSRIAREMEIPMVVGTDSAFQLLHDGQEVSVAASEGVVGERGEETPFGEEGYGAEEPERPTTRISDSITATEIMVSFSSDDYRHGKVSKADGGILNLKDEGPQEMPSFDMDRGGGTSKENQIREVLESVDCEVWVNAGAGDVEEVSEALRKLHLSGRSNGHMLVSSVSSPEEYTASVQNLSIPNTMKTGAVIETPIMALSVGKLAKQRLDILVINLPGLAELLFGSNSVGEDVVSSDALWDIVEDITEKCRENEIKSCIAGGVSRRFLEKFIETGVDCISVPPDSFDSVKNAVARAERKFLLERMR